MSSIEKIISCLEQKNIFLNNIINLTKQIQVKVTNDEIEFENIIQQRQNNMDKCDKCDDLIKSTLNEFPANQKQELAKVLSNNESDYFNDIKLLVKKQIELIHIAYELDNVTSAVVNKRYDNLKENLIQSQNKAIGLNTNKMFR
ncbi:MAG: hypothetical protein RSE93_03940 [Oscillospiraceae bacterium]